MPRSTDTAPAESSPRPGHVPHRTERRAWVVLVMIVVFMMISYADKAVLGLAAVPLMEELGIGKSTYGLISSSFYLLFSLSGLVVGFFSARISSRTLLLTMAALWAIAQLPVLLVAAVPSLIAGRVLLGVAEGPAASMSMRALYKWFPAGRRGLPSALQIGGAALGTAVSAPLLTWLIVDRGWRSAFVALMLVSAAWCLVWPFVGHDGPFGGERKSAGERKPTERAGRPSRAAGPPLRALLTNGTVAGGILSAFGSHWALALSSAWLPVYLQVQMGMSATGASTVISGVSVVSLVLLLSVPAYVDRLKRRGVSSRRADGIPQGAAVLVAGCALALLPFAGGGPVQLLLTAMAFGCHAVALPLHYVTTATVVPDARRGAVFGVVAASGTLPGLFVPYLTGHLVDNAATEAAGYTAAFLLSAGVMAVCGLLAIVTIRPERDARRLNPAAAPAPAPQAGGSKPVAQ
ncbi:MFS transporter [Streptomyces sp. OUCMDZ-3434]|uniref:MFS transporter n=1 Tax=Streptomyces sp. OUCMDZ-3434 TaxID=1535304 RepID=UPI001E3D5562|nr:MFS transporter [Streptomyces sp. OUCMDZ-3434]